MECTDSGLSARRNAPDLPRARRSAQSPAGCSAARRGRARGCRGVGRGVVVVVLLSASGGRRPGGRWPPGRRGHAHLSPARAQGRARARAHTGMHRHSKRNTRPLCTSRHCRWDTDSGLYPPHHALHKQIHVVGVFAHTEPCIHRQDACIHVHLCIAVERTHREPSNTLGGRPWVSSLSP